jgi:TM2 domain-containing membrane protein YozV
MNYDQSALLNQEPGQMSISNKDKTVAGILGILLGGLGIHRMYMGYVGIGLLQLVLTIFTFGLAGLWGFIEGVLILVQDDWTDSQGRLLKGNEKGQQAYYQGITDELNTPAGSSHKYRKLSELNELKEKGIITQQEFDIEKRKIW